MSKYDDLVAKLKEIFQIDRPELDFGVYRILNARAGEINDYLDNRLKARVQEALVNSGNANLEQVRKELEEAEKNAQSLGMNPDDVPKVRELRQRIAELSAGSVEHENAVFSHLLTFFSRYYDSGDFISQRRYKGDTYAIPYAGEEVVLHWANKDQYYTKSGENFANYSFRLADGRTVHFRLVAADTAKDNRKDSDKERRFVLIERQTRAMTDDDGDEYEEELLPVEEANGELVLRFEYRPMPKGSKQDDLVGKAVQAILGNDAAKSSWLDLAKREPTEKNPQRTLLEKHLTTYTQKNSADYFIHKDLGGFLRRELDFYIKNEVMHLDDVQNAERFADIEKNLRMIQCLRAIALDLITFLAQLEDFQKKLWEKKKFVVAAHYCITLDRVIKDAPELLDTIAANERQWEQWGKLGMLETGAAKNSDYLKTHPFLMVDTALFDLTFKDKLLRAIDNLDESLDGLLVHGDNFAALDSFISTNKHCIRNIYIDPPYNTGDDGFLYKDAYPSSSWISMIDSRLDKGMELLADSGAMFISIGDEEQEHLATLLRQKYGKERFFSTLVWEKKKKGSFLSGSIARMKDYILCISKCAELFSGLIGEIASDIETYPCVNASNPREIRIIKPGISSKYREKDFLFKAGEVISAGNMNLVLKSDLVIKNGILDSELVIEGNWRYSQESMSQYAEKKELYITQDLYLRRIVSEPRHKRMKDLLPRVGSKGESDFRAYDISDLSKYGWGTNEDANDELHQLLGEQYAASYPKPSKLLTLLLASTRHKQGFWLDYFAGSGTTGHAVINLNRQDNGQRKYILVEQGEYFDTVLKPRLQKVVYSADWKDGKATAPETGISHAFKVLKIESYEDTLNNLELCRNAEQQSLLEGLGQEAKDDYLLRYMLDIESRGSILSVDSFRKPFDCTLKVAVDSAGAWEERTIDLVETFNYLIGLKVKQIDSLRERGIVMVQGTLPTGEKTLILWRDCEQVDYEALNRFCDSHDINPRDSEFEVVYINGDHNIPSVLTTTEEEGGITKVLKLRLIEPEFLSRMFDGDV